MSHINNLDISNVHSSCKISHQILATKILPLLNQYHQLSERLLKSIDESSSNFDADENHFKITEDHLLTIFSSFTKQLDHLYLDAVIKPAVFDQTIVVPIASHIITNPSVSSSLKNSNQVRKTVATTITHANLTIPQLLNTRIPFEDSVQLFSSNEQYQVTNMSEGNNDLTDLNYDDIQSIELRIKSHNQSINSILDTFTLNIENWKTDISLVTSNNKANAKKRKLAM